MAGLPLLRIRFGTATGVTKKECKLLVYTVNPESWLAMGFWGCSMWFGDLNPVIGKAARYRYS